MKKILSLILLLCLLVPMVPSYALTEVTVGTITVNRYVTTNATTSPLEGVTYTITQTHKYDETTGNLIALTTGDTAYTANETTNASGAATFSNVPVGRYNVVETAVPAGTILNSSVYVVTLPNMVQDGETSSATIDAKGSSSFTSTKEQGTMENGTFTPATGNMPIMRETPYQYRLGTQVPSDIQSTVTVDGAQQPKYTSITFTDTMSTGLEYLSTPAPVVVNGDTTLAAGTDYTITHDATTNELTVTLTPAGIAKLAPETMLYVIFTAQISADADMTTGISNTSDVQYTYTDEQGNEQTTDPIESEEVITILPSQTITVTKVDSEDQTTTLAGATFELHKAATVDDIDRDNNTTRVGTEQTTDANGTITFQNLSDGTYFLVETQAPTGYNLLSEPVQVTLANGQSAEPTIQNVKTIIMPGTGGFGPILYALLGVIAVILAFYFILSAKRRKEEAK